MYGLLGINARNQKYIKISWKKRRILDSKLTVKRILEKVNLPVLKTFAIIETRRDLINFDWESLPNAFALKPNRGFGGEGIVVVYGKKKKAKEPTWIKADKSLITKKEIETHILNILEGNFSLYSLPDIAFFEERLKVIKELKHFSWRGIPDIRVILYHFIPVIAMLRLPTVESEGKANLHRGGIGVGIDLATGFTTNAIHHRRFIDYYPSTRYLLRGIKIPFFKKILNLSILVAKTLRINFLGVDIAIDKEKGPVIVEVNVRPGLDIQIANLTGLEERLKRVKGLKLNSEERGIRIALDLFGESEKEEIEEMFGKKILGSREEVEIEIPSETNPQLKKKYKILAKIDTGAWRSAVCIDLAKKLGIKTEGDRVKYFQSALGKELRYLVPLSFILKGERINTEVCFADRSEMRFEMIVGRRDLKNFFIDPSKK